MPTTLAGIVLDEEAIGVYGNYYLAVLALPDEVGLSSTSTHLIGFLGVMSSYSRS